MAKTLFVLSTLSTATTYAGFVSNGEHNLPSLETSVTIEGKAGIADRRTLVTPQGAVTAVTEDEAKFLSAHPLYQLHAANGFVTIVDSRPGDIDSAIAGELKGRAPDAPLVDADYNADDTTKAVPTTAKSRKG